MCAYPGRVVREFFGIGDRAGMQRHGDTAFPGNDVKVHVKHRLPGLGTIELRNHHARRVEGRAHRPGHPPSGDDQARQGLVAQIEQVLSRLPGDYQRVAGSLGHQVHERQAMLFVENGVSAQLAAENLRKNVVGVVGHGAHVNSPKPGQTGGRSEWPKSAGTLTAPDAMTGIPEATMTPMDEMDGLIEAMAAATRANGTLPKLPAGLTLDEAYEIQKALVAAVAGDAVAGRKAGMTAPESREQFGIPHPLLGTLFAAGLTMPGASFPSAPGVMLECEIGVVIGSDGAPITAGPVIEVPRMAFADGENLNAASFVASSISADRYIAGSQLPLLDSYDDIQVTLKRDGETVSSAPATDALGGPLTALDWMLGESRSRGFSIAENMLFITGACGGIHPALPGSYRADYGALGSIEFTVTG